jgi:hypothetical protein
MPLFDVNLKNQEAEKLFKRLNEATDATINYVQNNEPKLKKALKGTALAGGTGMVAKGISDARMNKHERDKLKAEKGYYDRMNKKLDDEDQYGRLKAKLEKNSAKRLLKTAMQLSSEDMQKIKDVAKKVGMNLAGAGAVALGTKGGADLYSAVKNKLNNQEKEYWNRFIRKYPEFEENTEIKEQFKFFYDTAPDLAKHPLAVKSFVKQISLTSGGQVHFNSVKDITSIQDSFNRRDNGAEDRVISGVNNLIHSAKDLSNSISEGPQKLIDQDLNMKERQVRIAKMLDEMGMDYEDVKNKVNR